MHLNKDCNRFASASKDGTVRVWDSRLRKTLFTLASHTAPVTCVKWGGGGWIYTASRDKSIKLWDGKDGKAKDEVLVNIVCQHARMNNAELPPPKKTDTFESNDMQRYCKSMVMSADPHKRTEQMRDFTAFAIKNYGLAIQYHDDNDILPDVRKLSNKDFGF